MTPEQALTDITETVARLGHPDDDDGWSNDDCFSAVYSIRETLIAAGLIADTDPA